MYMWAVTEIAVHGAKFWAHYDDTMPEEENIQKALEKICEDKRALPELAGRTCEALTMQKRQVAGILRAIAREHLNILVTIPTEEDSQLDPSRVKAEETGVWDRFIRILPFGGDKKEPVTAQV